MILLLEFSGHFGDFLPTALQLMIHILDRLQDGRLLALRFSGATLIFLDLPFELLESLLVFLDLLRKIISRTRRLRQHK